MKNPWLGAGAVSGALAVALGAFGAHALKESVPADDLEIWRTAVLYHLVHALALSVWGALREHAGWRTSSSFPAWAFAAGSLIFSGSLYAIVLGGPRSLGAITPIGGVLLIAAWVGLAAQALRRTREP